MEINSRLRVELGYVVASGESQVMHIAASDFFEFEDYDETEWGCDLPWRRAALDEYLPPGEARPREVTGTIVDIKTGVQRKVHIQNLLSSRLILSWDDIRRDPGRFEVILDIANDDSSKIQIARFDVDGGRTRLASHCVIDGESCVSLMQEGENGTPPPT